jgi:hypothetical protein
MTLKYQETEEEMNVCVTQTMNSFIKKRDHEKKCTYDTVFYCFFNYFSSVPDHTCEGPG